MVFFMVSTLMTTGNPAPIQDFCWLFNIEGETVVPEGLPGGSPATVG
jgi:hypothetical protein